MAKVEKVWAITLFDMCTAMYWSQEHFWWDSEVKVMAKVAKPCTGAERFATEGEDNSKPLSSTFGGFQGGEGHDEGWQRVAKVQEITLFAMHRLIIQSQGFPVEAGAGLSSGMTGAIGAASRAFGLAQNAREHGAAALGWPVAALVVYPESTLERVCGRGPFWWRQEEAEKVTGFWPKLEWFVKEAQPFTKAYPS
ncbi:hypothetical protein B0H13DRAFT_2275692 [Mycena leptocephala]|nr:hypothetical protein B0H13DRAFT_2275692 [Mycena leptocephala]